MTGTFLNVAAILIGGMIGLIFGARIPEKLKETVIAGMGLFTAALGLQMFLKTEHSLIVLGALLIGTLLGEWWRIEDGLRWLGEFLEKRFSHEQDDGSNKFVRGFLTASLLFCVGPVAILGSIQDGLNGDYNLLAVKSVLDGFACDRLCIDAGDRCALFSGHHSFVSGRPQPVSRAVECHCDPLHDERIDRHRWGDPVWIGDQQPARDQKDPCRKYAARSGGRAADRVAIDVVLAGLKPKVVE